MPKISGSSSGANIHPYLRPEFVWPEPQYSNDFLCYSNDEEFTEKRIEEYRQKRTFYLNEKLCKMFHLEYYQKGAVFIVDKNVLFERAKPYWDQKHLKQWLALKEQTVRLVNNGTSWWTAETTWIKAKI